MCQDWETSLVPHVALKKSKQRNPNSEWCNTTDNLQVISTFTSSTLGLCE